MQRRSAAFVLIAVFFTGTVAQAAMRCGTELINEGDRTSEVLRKCGQPSSREVLAPLADQSGRQINTQAVPVENWVYGPENGMYRYLRFVDGELVQIRSKRD